MRTPAEFGRLKSFRDEAFDRPCVDEDVQRLRPRGALRVAFGDVNAFHPCVSREPRPVVATLRLAHLEPDVARDVEQGLLDEPRHHSGIGPAAGDRSRPLAERLALVEHFGAQRIVGALRQSEARVHIEAGPRLADRIDVKRAQFMREADDRRGRNFDGEIDDEGLAGSFGEQRLQEIDEIFPRHGLLDEFIAALVDEMAVDVDRIDYREARPVEMEMALDQGQSAASDRAEADHDDGACDRAVHRPVLHRFLRRCARRRGADGTVRV